MLGMMQSQRKDAAQETSALPISISIAMTKSALLQPGFYPSPRITALTACAGANFP